MTFGATGLSIVSTAFEPSRLPQMRMVPPCSSGSTP
jgi:hypothetical protein